MPKHADNDRAHPLAGSGAAGGASGGLESRRTGALKGSVRVPGDKSISHRALMIGALAVGESVIDGLLEGEDVLSTAAALQALGAELEREAPGRWRVHGVGVGGLSEPAGVLDLGNAGTAARLLMGVVASHPFTSFFTGDASLRARPMGRVAAPLESMGAQIVPRSGCRLPLAVLGAESPLPISYRLPVPSAQVKSAILLAGLNAPGETTVIEAHPSRDHTERMLRHFGAVLSERNEADGAHAISLVGQPELSGCAVSVPGDFSSAAFALAAALLVPESAVTIENVGLNPLRTGLIETLVEMGGAVEIVNRREHAGEPVGDIRVRASALEGVEVPAERAPRMIDEYPILAVLAACGRGRTVMHGLAELRVKESDRLAGMARGLAAAGVSVTEQEDALIVEGCAGPPPGGATIPTRLDHRIAMAFLVLGMVAERPVAIDDGAPINTSFPGFVSLMIKLGAAIDGSR